MHNFRRQNFRNVDEGFLGTKVLVSALQNVSNSQFREFNRKRLSNLSRIQLVTSSTQYKLLQTDRPTAIKIVGFTPLYHMLMKNLSTKLLSEYVLKSVFKKFLIFTC